MKFRLSVSVIAFLLGMSTGVFAYEAPVVDVQQTTADTQPDNTASGSGWQTVTNDSAPQAQPAAPSTPAPQPASQPVAEQQWSAPSGDQSGDVNQRVSRLEQQMANYTQMNLPQQVSDMQQKISQLQGQVEVDQRELKTLTAQQKTYYQDLEQQMTQLQQQKGVATPSQPATPSTNSASTQNTTTAAATVNTAATLASDIENDKQDQAQKRGAPTLADTNAYNNAFKLLSDKHFHEARTAFESYLKTYPSGHFSPNAHFWLGEIALMNQHYDTATKQFGVVVSQYPKSSKVPDARLKIAMIHAAQGKTDLAKKEFLAIRKSYPGSTAAQLASIRLQQIAGGMAQ